MSLIPAKASRCKLSSWVFDGHIAKDCGWVPVKVAGIGTCSSCGSLRIKSKDAFSAPSGGTGFSKSLVRNLPAVDRLAPPLVLAHLSSYHYQLSHHPYLITHVIHKDHLTKGGNFECITWRDNHHTVRSVSPRLRSTIQIQPRIVKYTARIATAPSRAPTQA